MVAWVAVEDGVGRGTQFLIFNFFSWDKMKDYHFFRIEPRNPSLPGAGTLFNLLLYIFQSSRTLSHLINPLNLVRSFFCFFFFLSSFPL